MKTFGVTIIVIGIIAGLWVSYYNLKMVVNRNHKKYQKVCRDSNYTVVDKMSMLYCHTTQKHYSIYKILEK